MAISLNFTSIADCNTATDVAADPNAGGTTGFALSPASEYQPSRRRGTDCIEFFNNATGIVGVKTITTTAFSIRENEVGIWFLNPLLDGDDARLLGNADSDLRIRVYSGTNWADYDQSDLKDFQGEYPGGWSYLTASGAAGTESRNSGTWTNTQADSVDSCAIIFNALVTTSSFKDAAYAVDWALYYDKIIVDGFNGGSTPWTFDDIFDTAVALSSGGGIWGVIKKQGNFFSVSCGIEFGDGTTNGAFLSENEYLNLTPNSADFDCDITVKSGFTLTLGEKNVGAVQTYAQDGTQFDAAETPRFSGATAEKCAPSFTIEDGGTVNAYASLFKRFGDVKIGTGTTDNTTMEFIGCDFFDNDNIEFRSSGATVQNCKFHFDGTDKSTLGTIFVKPALLEGIEVFQCTDAFDFRVSTDVTRYIATDTSFDLVILEGEEVSLINSEVNPNKLKRST